MNPVIPKIRPGEILRGTRNMRNWLQMGSLLLHLENLNQGGGGRRGGKPLLFTPKKDDKFIVVVNNFGIFGTWIPRENILILFANPKKSSLNKELGASSKYLPPSLQREERMNPKIFAQWFVRTQERFPDVSKWSPLARTAWISLHNGAGRLNNRELVVSFPLGGAYRSGMESTFAYGMRLPRRYNENPFNQFLVSLKAAMIKRSSLEISRGKSESLDYNGRGEGPLLSDLKDFRITLSVLAKNSRTRKKMESGPSQEIKLLLKYMKEQEI